MRSCAIFTGPQRRVRNFTTFRVSTRDCQSFLVWHCREEFLPVTSVGLLLLHPHASTPAGGRSPRNLERKKPTPKKLEDVSKIPGHLRPDIIKLVGRSLEINPRTRCHDSIHDGAPPHSAIVNAWEVPDGLVQMGLERSFLFLYVFLRFSCFSIVFLCFSLFFFVFLLIRLILLSIFGIGPDPVGSETFIFCDHGQDPLPRDLLHVWSWSSDKLLL